MRNFSKNIGNLLNYSEIQIFDVLTAPKGSGSGVNFNHCHAYLQALGSHGL